jgi:hypothetical protein
MKWQILVLAPLFLLSCGQKTNIKKDIEKAFKAANNHDYSTFEKYVDVEGLGQSYMKSCLDNETNAFAALLAGPVNEKIKKNMREFIETDGAVDSRALHINGIRIDGNTAYAICGIFYPKYSMPCSLTVRLRKNPDNWQVADVDISDIVKMVRVKTDSIADHFDSTIAVELTNGYIVNMIDNYKGSPNLIEMCRSRSYFNETLARYKYTREMSIPEIYGDILSLLKKKGGSTH